MGEQRNLLEMVPHRREEWCLTESGEVRILVPRYGRSSLGRWVAARLRRPHITVNLDRLGSAVWKACDGETSVGGIADRLEETFGDDAAPIHERLETFLQELERGRFIKWQG
jgi:hypothetical protein